MCSNSHIALQVIIMTKSFYALYKITVIPSFFV